MMATLTVEDLVARATSGPNPDKKRNFHPSMLYSLINMPFNIWCDYHVSKKERVGEETSRYNDLQIALGGEYEEKWVKENCPGVVTIPKTYDRNALLETFKAMLAGAPYIHAPQLWLLSEELYGTGDVLVRSDDHPSDLGAWHYRVIEVKRSKKIDLDGKREDYKVMQTLTYHRILSRLQGYAPPTMTVVLREGQEEIPVAGLDSRLDDLLDLWRTIRDGSFKPESPEIGGGDSPWQRARRPVR